VNGNWPIKTLGEVCGFVRGPFGGSLKKSVFVEDGFAVYEQQHAIYDQFDEVRYFIDEPKFREMQRFELRPRDLIMSCSGTMGKVAIVPDDIRRGIINQALLKLTTSSAVAPEFLKYWMGSADFQDALKQQSGGAAIQNVASVGILKQIQMTLPAIPEQRRIVGILDEAFEGIATAKANAERNLKNARALFESHLEAVFGQRAIGWQEKRLGELATFRNGINFTKSSRGDSMKIVGVKDFRNNFWAPFDDLDTVVTDGPLPESDLLQEHDILFVRSNGNPELIGRCLLVGKPPERATHSGFTIRARLEDGRVAPKYLCRFLKSGRVRREMIDGGNGVNIKSLNQTTLSSLAIPLPSFADQLQIARQLEGLDLETTRLSSIYEQKLAAVDELKKSLLHRAFSGEL
jgi:type I restriction enzyme S subunit